MGDALPSPSSSATTVSELLARVFQVCGQRFALFYEIAFWAMLPSAIANIIALHWLANALQGWSDFPHSLTPAHPFALPAAFWEALGATVLLQWLLVPFAWSAITHAVGNLSGQQRLTWLQCYAAVTPRAWTVVAVIVLEACIAIATICIISVAMTLAAVATTVALLPKQAAPSAIVAPVIIVTAIDLVVVGFAGALLLFAAQFGYFAATIERESAAQSVLSGFARVFNRPGFGRAVLMAVAVLAFYAVFFVFGVVCGVLIAAWTRTPVVSAVIGLFLQPILSAFIGALGAVYYFDVRGHRESVTNAG